MKDIKEIVLAAFAGIVIIIGIYAVYKAITLGDDERDYSTICIGGHQYYFASFGAKAVLSIRFDRDGKPVDCAIGQGE